MSLPEVVIRQTKRIIQWCNTSAAEISDIHTLQKHDDIHQLAEINGAQNVCLVISPEYLIFRQLELPASNYKINNQSISWLAEESLLEECEQLHWTVIERRDQLLYVAGISGLTLRELIAPYKASGINITCVTPDGYYLPWEDETWSAIKCDDAWLVRTGEFNWCEIDENWASHLFTHYRPANIISFSPLSENNVDYRPWKHPLISHCEYPGPSGVNLLHGAFRPVLPATPVSKRKQTFSWACFAICILSLALTQGYNAWHLHTQKISMQTESKTIWHKYFPGDKHSGNYKFYFPQMVKDHYPDVLTQLSGLQEYLKSFQNIKLISVRYDLDGHRFIIKLTTSSPDDVTALIKDSTKTFNFKRSTSKNDNNIYELISEKTS